jgi:hypothetical protein
MNDIFARAISNYYGSYIPNLHVAIAASAIWAVILFAIIFKSWRYKVWYLTVMVVGLLSKFNVKYVDSAVETAGYVMRVYGHFNPGVYGPYLVMELCVV